MIQVRDTFQVKFGKIDEAVDLFQRFPREVLSGLEIPATFELRTDLSGPMFLLEESWQIESLDAWRSTMQATFAGSAFQEWFRHFQQHIEDGQREFFNVEQANAGWSGEGALVVRTCFRAREWRIREVVELAAAYGAMLQDCGVGERPRVLTDASGRMFNVVIEVETPDLKVWDDHRRSMFRDPQFQVWFGRLRGCVVRGAHEFYRVVG